MNETLTMIKDTGSTRLRLSFFATLGLLAVVPLVTSCSSSSSEKANVKKTETVAVQEGVPGGIFIETYEGNGTITAINPETRTFTMVRPDGTQGLFKAGPGMVNFPQLRVGDKVKATLTDEMVVFVKKKDATAVDGAATAVVLAPKGAKPGGVVADTVQVTAIVKAVDLEHHKATLQFPDGSTKTIAVRPDVELSAASVGTEVVIRKTQALALSVEKP